MAIEKEKKSEKNTIQRKKSFYSKTKAYKYVYKRPLYYL